MAGNAKGNQVVGHKRSRYKSPVGNGFMVYHMRVETGNALASTPIQPQRGCLDMLCSCIIVYQILPLGAFPNTLLYEGDANASGQTGNLELPGC